MKEVKLPSRKLMEVLSNNSNVVYRRKQVTSDLPNHKEYGTAWMDGYKYGVESVLASFGPQEAQSKVDIINEILLFISEKASSLTYELKKAKDSERYYQGERE